MSSSASSSTLPIPSSIPESLASSITSDFILPASKLTQIVDVFRQELEAGLKNYGQDVAMVPSFVPAVPDGSEKGVFLALDLGGTNLRVCEVKLLGSHRFDIRQQKYKVSDSLKNGEATVLFDYIAESVDNFMTDVGTDSEDGEPIHLGFTFSFPVEQTALNKGKLLTWTKGFQTKNAIGHDVVGLLQDSLDKKHIHVQVSALVNDTVGTLLSRSYQKGPALIGAIFGTGTNGAYIDKVETITKLGEKAIAESKKGGVDAGEYMVVNTEWGAHDNGRHCLPVSIFDNKLDRESINPRKQAFEKMVSGMYLGEIARNMLIHLIDRSVLFDGHSSAQLNSHYGLDTALVSAIEEAGSDEDVVKVLTGELGMDKKVIKPADVEIVRWACRLVASRAASLAAAAIAAVIKHTRNDVEPGKDVPGKEDGIDVGIDGSVAEFLPHFQERVRVALREILGEEVEKRITMGLARDGSGVGAALCALQAKKAQAKSSHPEVSTMDATRNMLQTK